MMSEKYENVNPHLVIDKGEKICNECNGWGYYKPRETTKDKESGLFIKETYEVCKRCLGRCTLEFIDAAVGQNRDPRWRRANLENNSSSGCGNNLSSKVTNI